MHFLLFRKKNVREMKNKVIQYYFYKIIVYYDIIYNLRREIPYKKEPT